MDDGDYISGTHEPVDEVYSDREELIPPPESYANGFGRAWVAALQRAERELGEGPHRFRVEHRVRVTKTNPLTVDEYRIDLIPI